MKKKYIILILLFMTLYWSCDKEDDFTPYVPEKVEESTDEIDKYFNTNYLEPYNTAVRWRWEDRLVDDAYLVTPVKREFCIPMGKFIKKYWIEPFEATEAGAAYLKKHFPPEIVFIGSSIFNKDGTRTLGYAESGVRISFSEVNDFNIESTPWILFQLRTAEHEFAHFVHQNYSLPPGFKEVTPTTYQYTNWVNLDYDVQSTHPLISSKCIESGMVTNYGTASVEEDFCEIVSIYLTSKEAEFMDRYYPKEGDSEEMIEGKTNIFIKLNLIKNYYRDQFNIDIDQLRSDILLRIYGPETESPEPESGENTTV